MRRHISPTRERRRRVRRSALLVVAAAALFTSGASAQSTAAGTGGAVAPAGKPTVPESEFGRWETLGAGTLSPDGRWLAYEIRRVNGVNELRYREIASDSTRVGPSGEGAVFSANSRWLAYAVGVTEAERERLTKAKKPVRLGLAIVDLRTGAVTSIADVQSFAFSADGNHLAIRRYALEGSTFRGADLLVRNLEGGTSITFGRVAEVAWSDAGARLAMVIDAESGSANGVQLLDASSGRLLALDGTAGSTTSSTGTSSGSDSTARSASYTGLAWRKGGDDLAVLRSRVDSTRADTGYLVLAWRGVGGRAAARLVYDPAVDSGLPADERVAPYRRPVWAGDGTTLFVGVAPSAPRIRMSAADSARRASEVEPASVEVWHARDERQIPAQKIQAKTDREKTHLAAWHLGTNRLVRLADDSVETMILSDDGSAALAIDTRPYRTDAMFGRPYRDVHRLDLATGRRERIVTRTPFLPSISPGGRFVLYVRDGHWWTHDLTTGKSVNLTGSVSTGFMDTEDDHPVAERSPYGVAGWSLDDASVLLYDRYDVWEFRPDGTKASRLTNGRDERLVHRIQRLDPEERALDPRKPIYLSLYGEWTKQSGFARLRLPGQVERLALADRSLARLIRAKNADVLAWVAQSWEDSPDYFVGGPQLGDAKQMSATNPFQAGYAWGKSELVSFTSARGDTLQGILTWPADYTPGTRYPMLVYIYEKLSQNLHTYGMPSERAPYNISSFSQRGYFVLRPDIVFRPRDPGYSEIEAVVPAVQSVLATGMVDPQRVGILGHSWGGYGSAFLATHTRIFAAANAGAPLTNLVSMYGYTSGNSGMAETGHFEVGQERMQVPLWEDPQAYIRNSTVFHLDSLRTPLLVEFGDRDGNVNFWQGVELYNAARRLGKNVVMLVYNDENHNVAKRSSQVDYHRRQLQWFDHYLKGAPAPEWVTRGQTFLGREREVKALTPGNGAGEKR